MPYTPCSFTDAQSTFVYVCVFECCSSNHRHFRAIECYFLFSPISLNNTSHRNRGIKVDFSRFLLYIYCRYAAALTRCDGIYAGGSGRHKRNNEEKIGSLFASTDVSIFSSRRPT